MGGGSGGGIPTAAVALVLGIVAVGAVLLADRPPPLRQVRVRVYPAVVICGSLASIALLVTALALGDASVALAAALVCVLYAAAGSRRSTAVHARHGSTRRRTTALSRCVDAADSPG